MILNLIFALSACTPAGSETTQNATDAQATEEIITEEASESTEQTENFAFEVLYSINERSSVKEEIVHEEKSN